MLQCAAAPWTRTRTRPKAAPTASKVLWREQPGAQCSTRISIALFLVVLCKFFATSRRWGVLASNSSVTAQQFKQAVLLEKIKGFVISHHGRGLLGRPAENLALLPASTRLRFLPISCFSLSLSPGNLNTDSLPPSHPCSQSSKPPGFLILMLRDGFPLFPWLCCAHRTPGPAAEPLPAPRTAVLAQHGTQHKAVPTWDPGSSKAQDHPPPQTPSSADGASTHAAPSTSSPGWSEVAVATPPYVIHPVRLQVCGGNGAILEVSLGSFLIISMASHQCSQPGHAPQCLEQAWNHGGDG